jgi:hypothetical protein|tara:strand:- start:270 stop:512 length:243 start_codon:yes stop_codon:yes gene_type:complete
MNVKLWHAKRSAKRIEKMEVNLKKFQSYVDFTKKCIKREWTKLDGLLKELDEKDNVLFGLEAGFIDREDYKEMMKKAKKE